MQRTRRTPEQKAEALELLATVGKAEAARLTGIPAGTIASWGSRGGVTAPPAEQTATATAARLVQWADRRAALANQMGETAAGVLEQLGKKYRKDELAAQRLASVLERLVKNAQLLVGDVTELVGTVVTEVEVDVSERRERALAVVRELHARAS